MRRIKKEYIGKTLLKGSTKILLREDMTDKEIKFIENTFSTHFIEEEVIVKKEIKIEEGKIIEEPVKRKRKK